MHLQRGLSRLKVISLTCSSRESFVYCISVNDFFSWRESARTLLANKISPELVEWTGDAQQSLFVLSESIPQSATNAVPRVSKSFIELAKKVACFDDAGQEINKWQLLYSLLWRLAYQSKSTLMYHSDPEVSTAYQMVKAVNRDRHKMKAFVRFKATGTNSYRAWFEPEHYIVESLAPFFVQRFTAMDWSILTPKGCAHWNQQNVKLTPGIHNPQLEADQYDEFWKVYYCAIFNPARLKEKAMTSEMPKKYWKYLPEASCIKSLATSSAAVVEDMVNAPLTEPERIRNQSNGVKRVQDKLRANNQN